MIQSNTYRRLLVAVGAALTTLALVAPAAHAQSPAPGYEQFAGCPTPEQNPVIEVCMRTVIDGGHFKMGNKNAPIQNPITLTGGTDASFENFDFNSEGGLTPVKQEVPGGLVGLTGLDWLVNFLSLEQLKLYAVTELAGTPNPNPLKEPIELPIKIHLINPVLGNNCYVGSNSNPIALNLITGTTEPPPPNEPITGKGPEHSFEKFPILSLENGTFVDNSFAAPGATGCGLNIAGLIPVNIDAIVNAASGLPSPAGTNETVQHFDIEVVDSREVYPQE